MDPIFSSNNDINEISKSLKKSALSLTNRLQSIIYDYHFVCKVHENFLGKFPLVANERCGLWYVPKKHRQDTCYFKSTDGHTNVWSFSMRRLNLHLLPLIQQFGGLVLVDSTRRGKLMPDALSKTIPIWCAVINCILYEAETKESVTEEVIRNGGSTEDAKLIVDLMADNWLRTPGVMVSENEHNTIVKLIPTFVQNVKAMGLFSQESLLESLGHQRKPLVPTWFYPSKKSMSSLQDSLFMYHICCLSTSKKVESSYELISIRTQDDSFVSWNYVQGSADDHELWVPSNLCNGNFGADLFWEIVFADGNPILDSNTGFIYSWLSDGELELRINAYFEQSLKAATTTIELHKVANTGLSYGKIDSDIPYPLLLEQGLDPLSKIVVLSESFSINQIPEVKLQSVLKYPISSSKKGSNMLRTLLPEIIEKLNFTDKQQIIVLCESGRDLSVGVILVLLCTHFNLNYDRLNQPPRISKDLVKQHLSKLSQISKANPSRSTLQSVNTYLFSHQ
ncbi:tRNA A64-2'-O-ribosylphosphate transferase [Spathaspora sp. JA1]|nr:tRNA A64-2'-O-ribosylphosphate transferase [Spathaspora sp. JA1]